MRVKCLAFLLLPLIDASNARAQDARSMLQASLRKYAELTTYHVEGTREWTSTDETQRVWTQEHFVVASAPGRRYHYDIKMPGLWDIVISDGKTEWIFQPWRNEYASRPVPEIREKASGPDDAIRAFSARQARNYLEDLSKAKIPTAKLLPDETITLAGQQIPCYVIRATYDNAEDAPAPKHPAQHTFWIDKDRGLVRKETVVTYDSGSALQQLHETNSEQTTYYTLIHLGGPVADGLFNFAQPNGAKQVSRLFLNDADIDLTGLPAPPLKLKTFDGKPFDPNSVKGRPVLVDFWASWCVPCVQQMRSLATLSDEFSKQGLVLIGINRDDDPNAATEFLHKNNYNWTNLRDVNGETAKSWMVNGIPVLAVIEPGGTIAYYHFGYEQPEETAILETLRKINPAFTRSTGSRRTAEDPPGITHEQ